MKKNLLFVSLLSAVVTGLVACSSADDEGIKSGPRQWNASFAATKDSGDVVTRALYIGGASGKRFISLWEESDNVQTYKDGSLVGILKPASDRVPTTELKGTLTGSFSVGDVLDLYLISPDRDYTGQTGALSDMTKFAYLATSVKIDRIDDSTIHTEKLSFHSKQFYLRFRFMDQDGIRLPIEQLTIHADGGMLLLTKPLTGAATYGDIVINTVKENGSYPEEVYVCMHNDLGAKDTYSFTVKSGGYIYASTDAASKLTYNLTDGTYNRVARTLTLQGSASRISSQLDTTINPHEDGGGDNNGSVAF
jgi:hypothetical protein